MCGWFVSQRSCMNFGYVTVFVCFISHHKPLNMCVKTPVHLLSSPVHFLICRSGLPVQMSPCPHNDFLSCFMQIVRAPFIICLRSQPHVGSLHNLGVNMPITITPGYCISLQDCLFIKSPQGIVVRTRHRCAFLRWTWRQNRAGKRDFDCRLMKGARCDSHTRVVILLHTFFFFPMSETHMWMLVTRSHIPP